VRVSPQTFRNWRNEDEAFRAAIEEAVALGMNSNLKRIADSAATDWRAAAWCLEHMHPEHFAKSRVEVTGADGAPLSAGIQLYLPKKDSVTTVEAGEVGQPLALSEGEGNGD
jgi:hypothetical protein